MDVLPRSLVDRRDRILRRGRQHLEDEIGGSARRRVVLLLAAVLGLNSADQGAIGAVAPNLESALRISNVDLGLLVTIAALVAALATLPFGSLVDRRNRVHLLVVVIILWGVAQAVSGISVSYSMLLITRVALGVVTAAAAPATASLTGDLFPSSERGRIYGYIITGEIIGAGFGVLVSGMVAQWFGWRPALALLAIPSVALSILLLRYLPEPARGGASWIASDADAIPATSEAPNERSDVAPTGGEPDNSPLGEAIEQSDAEPASEIVISHDGSKWNLWEAIRYVLKVRTNIIIIVSSSLGYFFFAGLKTFALLFIRGHYGVGQAFATMLVVVVGAGAMAGVILGGRGADRSIERGRVTARLDVGVGGFIIGAALLVPAIVTTSLGLAVPLMLLAAAAIAGPNATLDAARLDLMPSQLWGRAEGIRNWLRTLLEAAAPLVFGLVSVAFGGRRSGFGVVAAGTKAKLSSAGQVRGLEDAFLLMLVLLAASGVLLLLGRRSYPTDVASAMESERRIASKVPGR